MTRQRKTLRGIDGAVITYMDHDELHLPGRIEELLDTARGAADRGSGAAQTGEESMFKALHGCACAIDQCGDADGYAGCSRGELHALHRQMLDDLVKTNIGLVYAMRDRAPPSSVDPDEFVSEGFWRLFQAVLGFDPWRGYRFSSYACTSIKRGFASLRRQERRRDEVLERLRHDSPAHISCGAGEDARARGRLAEEVHAVLLDEDAGFSPVERFVIVRRLLHPVQRAPETLKAIGAILHLGKERVRQIQLTALNKLRYILGEKDHGVARPPIVVETHTKRVIASGEDGEDAACRNRRSSVVAA